MPHICLDESDFYFPPPGEADEDGLVLIGGSVTSKRILEAYKRGIFPWYNEDDLPLWWSPDPRFVLYPGELHISRSMKKVFAAGVFEFKINSAFEEVIHHCATVKRKDQPGTWLTKEMKEAYIQLHYEGHAHSAEAWVDGKLQGGMYGIRIGNIFFGESMFSKTSNASKFAFIKYVQHLAQHSVELIDCQVYTQHVESLGGRHIDRMLFLQLLSRLTSLSSQ